MTGFVAGRINAEEQTSVFFFLQRNSAFSPPAHVENTVFYCTETIYIVLHKNVISDFGIFLMEKTAVFHFADLMPEMFLWAEAVPAVLLDFS